MGNAAIHTYEDALRGLWAGHTDVAKFEERMVHTYGILTLSIGNLRLAPLVSLARLPSIR